MSEPNNPQVQIYNSEYGRSFNLYIRLDRLQEFKEFVKRERYERQPSSMPGLSWPALLGLDAIFARRPKKFPVEDLLDWLASGIQDNPPVTKPEIEYALERFSSLYPPDISEDA
jgi:hypothetical protein